MNINRHNYEEYFILYLDNELDSESRCRVEVFAHENPDLKAELDMLLQSKLTPDNDIAFTDKGSLMRFDSSSISLTNYEEWLTSYIDNELTGEERDDVEKFVAANPAVQKELNLLQKTKLQPEAIVFPYKESLYRKEEKARIVAIRWRRIAAAAVLLLGISTTAIVLINKKRGDDNVATTPTKKEKSTNNTTSKQLVNESPVNDQVASVIDQKKDEPVAKKGPGNTIAAKQKNSTPEEKKEQPVQLKNEEPLIAQNKDKQPSNNLPQPDNNPNVTGQADPNNGNTASINTPKDALTIPQENMGVGSVTPGVIHTSQLSTPDDGEGVEKSSGNKGLRGFLRKVTRTFEKRTNIKATDDDDRLLIAGLSIKMN